MASSLNTTFSRTFFFSIVLTLLISVLALLLFRFFAAEYTANYHAQSMVAKYQLIEAKFGRPKEEFSFEYRIEEQPIFSDKPLPFYFDKVFEEIRTFLSSESILRHSNLNDEVFVWFKSIGQEGAWIGIQLSHENKLFTYYGWAYILLVVFVSILPVYFFARTISRPISVLSEAAESIAGGGLSDIKPKLWPKEITTLAKVLSIASHKLKDQTKSKEEMLLGISHDLRTPLTRARLAVDFLEKHDPGLVSGIVEDLDEMDQIIDQFIVFAREGRPETKESVDICDLVLEVSDKFEGVHVELPAPFTACVSPLSIKRLLSNLISNAFKYGDPPIEICVDETNDKWSITVIDSGKGIPENLIDEVIKPFTTLDNAGTQGKGGLGLAIVDRIVKNHGGDLKFYKSGCHQFAVSVGFPK